MPDEQHEHGLVDTSRFLDYKQPERNAKTYVGTPRESTKRNSAAGDPSRIAKDASLERIDQEAMSLGQGAGGRGPQHRQHKQINITNQIHKTYTVQGNAASSAQPGGRGDAGDGRDARLDSSEQDAGPSAMDLQAQILLELQQANSLAKKTKSNVKKIAKSAKPALSSHNVYVGDDELDRLEDEVTNGGGLNNSQQLLTIGAGNDHGLGSAARLGSASAHRSPAARRHASPSK